LRFPGFDDEWEVKKFGEIAKFSKGKGISKIDIDENGETECIRYGELYTHYGEVITDIKSKTNIDKSSLVFSEGNDVIIPASGETQIDIATASCVLNSGVALGGDLNIIKTKNNGVFLSYYLNSKKKLEIAKLSQGISVVHLYSSQLALLNLKLPQLEEQEKLAHFLSLLNSRIHTQKKIIGDLKFLKKEITKKIINQELKFNNYLKTSVNWEKKRLGQIGKFYAGGDLNKLEYQKEKNDEYIYPIYANGSEAGLYGYSKTFQFPSDCVTVSGRGNLGFANVRKTPFCAIVRLIVIIPNDNINSKFLEEIINYTNFVIESTGVPQLTIPQISNYSILVPCLEEQNRIAHFLSSFDDKLYIEKKLLTQYENQKKYLLQNLFV